MDMLPYDNRLRSIHCREFFLQLCRPDYFFGATYYNLTLAMSMRRFFEWWLVQRNSDTTTTVLFMCQIAL